MEERVMVDGLGIIALDSTITDMLLSLCRYNRVRNESGGARDGFLETSDDSAEERYGSI
jgi:hypothetical protein